MPRPKQGIVPGEGVFAPLIWRVGLSLLACAGCSAPHDAQESAAEDHAVSSFVATDDDANADDSPSPKAVPDAAHPAAPSAPTKSKGVMLSMPGKSFTGTLPELSVDEQAVAQSLRADVEHLAGDIGERNVQHHRQLIAAADFIDGELVKAGYQPARQSYDTKGRACDNIEVELAGGELAGEIVIVGAHYDSANGTAGANDNGSGAAALLTLARRLAGVKPTRTVRFVAFVNEEMPYFETDQMGSLVYARRCRARKENVVAMVSLETIGYYSDAPNSQKYPLPFSLVYPSTGNFIGFIGDVASGELVQRVVTTFRRETKFPSEGGALPGEIDGVGWSDHWSFWQQGYPAVMVTDTALFRYPHYHAAEDTPDKLDYDRLARVVVGLDHVVRDLAGE